MHVKSRTGARGVPRFRPSIARKVPWISTELVGREAGPCATPPKVPRASVAHGRLACRSYAGRFRLWYRRFGGPGPTVGIPVLAGGVVQRPVVPGRPSMGSPPPPAKPPFASDRCN